MNGLQVWTLNTAVQIRKEQNQVETLLPAAFSLWNSKLNQEPPPC